MCTMGICTTYDNVPFDTVQKDWRFRRWQKVLTLTPVQHGEKGPLQRLHISVNTCILPRVLANSEIFVYPSRH